MPKEKPVCPLPYTNFLPGNQKKFLSINKIKNVIELGCGNGAYLYALCTFLQEKTDNKQVAVYGLDINKDSIENAKQSFPYESEFIVGDANEFENSSGRRNDLIVSNHVIEHVENMDAYVDTMKKLSRTGSAVFLSTVIRQNFGVWFYRRNGRFVIDPTHLREFRNREEVTAILKSHGFAIVSVEVEQFKLPIKLFLWKIISIFTPISPKSNRKVTWLNNLRVPIFGWKNLSVIAKH